VKGQTSEQDQSAVNGSEDRDHPLEVDDHNEGCLPGVIAALGELKPRTVITEDGLAQLFDRCTTSVKRAVERGELPPPCRLFGGNVWTVESVLQHIEARLEDAAQERERMEQKLKHLSP
jgi:hypothetical protein